MLNAAHYRPPLWLRNAHVQSVLGGAPRRRRRGEQRLAGCGATTTAHLIDGGDGVRLQGLHSVVPGMPARGRIGLQHHGSMKDGVWNSPPALVQFRNIFVKEL